MMVLQGEAPNIGDVVLHHTADAYAFGIETGLARFEFLNLHWGKFLPDMHLGPLTINLTPTKHVVFLFIAAGLVFLTMWWTGRRLERQRAGERAPSGLANAMEAVVLFVRNDIAIANIGHNGPAFAPYALALAAGLFADRLTRRHALLLFALRDDEANEGLIRNVALGISLLVFAATLVLWAQFDPNSADFQMVERHAWIPAFGIT